MNTIVDLDEIRTANALVSASSRTRRFDRLSGNVGAKVLLLPCVRREQLDRPSGTDDRRQADRGGCRGDA